MIRGRPGLDQPARRRRRIEAHQKPVERAKIERAVAPLQNLYRVIAVILDLLHELRLERLGIGGDAESAVVHVAPGAPGDLSDFFGPQGAHNGPVEFLPGGEGDMVDIHVDAHSDRIGGDHEIDFARLIERHLRVARARAERAQDHGSSAALAPHRIGEAVNVLDRERDDGGTAGQARKLLRSGIGQVGETRPRDEMGLRRNARDGAPHGSGAEPHGFFFAARMDQPVGEDMAAFGIGAELDLVDAKKRHRNVDRHGFHGADEKAREFRNDAFLARDQRDIGGAFEAHDLVVDLAREQPERQSDHAGAVRQHALDGEMRLAGIGRAKDRGYACPLRMGNGAPEGLPRTPVSHRLYPFSGKWFRLFDSAGKTQPNR